MNVFIDRAFDADYQRAPLVLVDVGASGGIDPKWGAAARHLQVIGFDADDRAPLTEATGTPRVTHLRSALHSNKSRLSFNLLKRQEVSSIYMPNRQFVDRFPESDRFDLTGTVELDADTLDNQLSGNGVAGADFIKADTQGSELLILQGAEHTLRRSVIGLELEVEFAPIYEGQPLFHEVDAFVRAAGFVLMDLRPYHWKRTAGLRAGGPKSQLVFADALYLRDLASLAALVEALPSDAERRSKVLHAMSVCAVYGYLDYALELFTQHAGLFTGAELAQVHDWAGREVWWGSRIPDFRGRGRLASWLGHLQRILQPSYRGWGTAGRVLGNL